MDLDKSIRSLIITKSKEYSSDRIIDWCLIQKVKILRCNTNSINSPKLKITSDLSNYRIIVRKLSRLSKNDLPIEFFNYLSKETLAYWVELLDRYKSQIVFGHHLIKEPLRIFLLESAKKCNLLVPDYIITSSKKELIDFSSPYSKVICKPLSTPQGFIHDNLDFGFRVAEINKKDIEKINDEFFPSYFQQKIQRDYEVRVFYLNGKCWAMAFVINSRNEVSPDIGNIKKRREVPFKIPESIQKKVVGLMDYLGYNTSSLDFIISKGEWYFLELNPSGQYDFVSKRCNYFLDREIMKSIKIKNEEYKN